MTIHADIEQLRAIAAKLDEIASRFANMVPQPCDRGDNILAASNAAYAAKSRSNDAATLMEWAIQKQIGGSDGH
jgi:hypothetical protein